jgi:hypothetical protein
MPRGGARPGAGRKAKKQIARPIVQLVLSDLAKRHTESAVKCLVAIMNDENAYPGCRITAAKEILDRGHGRAVQHVEGKNLGGDTVINIISNVERAPESKIIDAEIVEAEPLLIEAAE